MSEVEQPEDDGQPTRPVEKHAARLDSLEGWKSFVEEHVIPRIDELEATVEQRDERISELQARVHELETQLEALDGLADDEASTPQKRAVDLARAMIRQAETRADGRIAKDYNDVKEDLATLGHEDLHDPQAYQAMDDVTAAAGFSETTVSRQGKQVQAVGVNLDALGEVDAVNEIKNEHGSEAADDTTEPVTETTP